MGKGWTTIGQSKRLVEAGLDLDTADMTYRKWKTEWSEECTPYSYYLQPDDDGGKFPLEFVKPCWSLGRLIDLMQRKIQFKGYDCYFHLEDYDESEFEIEYHCSAKGMTLKWWHGESLVDICVDALCWQFTTKIQ